MRLLPRAHGLRLPGIQPTRDRHQRENGAADAVPDAQYLHGLFHYMSDEGIVQDRGTAAEMFILTASSGRRPVEIVRRELEDNEPDQ